MLKWELIGRAWQRAKIKNINFRLKSVAQKVSYRILSLIISAENLKSVRYVMFLQNIHPHERVLMTFKWSFSAEYGPSNNGTLLHW